MTNNNKNIALAMLYFFLSTLLTAIFIVYKIWLYPSINAMILSGAIAGAKWSVQLVAAVIFLGKEKWLFIKKLGVVCLVGSVLLFSYNLMYFLPLQLSGFTQFKMAVALAVVAMVILYYRAVKQSNLHVNWFIGWLVCLIIAIVLQLTIVF